MVPYGEKAQVFLADGTEVFLNAGSHLKYPSSFTKKNRQVILSGEAFFDVKKDPDHPFIINAPYFDVKVLGTSFNMQAYEDDMSNSLTLHSGLVWINKNGREYKVHPGEKYIYNDESKISSINMADIGKSSRWKEGTVVIENLNLDEIQKVLERKFNVQIEIMNDKLKDIKYTGQFKPHENLEEILYMIIKTSPIKFKYEENNTRDMILIRE